MKYFEDSLLIFYERLRRKIEYFRNGDYLIAIDMAVQIRTLVYDTPKSFSLLSHLNQKHLQFFDSSDKNWMNGGVSYRKFGDGISNINYLADGPLPSSLVGAEHTKRDNHIVTNFLPIFFEWKSTFIMKSFENWWNEEVAFINDTSSRLTRSQLVLGISDKDGGAHFDKNSYEMEFQKLKANDLMMVLVNGVPISTENFPLYAIICQIAHEVLKSIEPLKNTYLQSK